MGGILFQHFVPSSAEFSVLAVSVLMSLSSTAMDGCTRKLNIKNSTPQESKDNAHLFTPAQCSSLFVICFLLYVVKV
jgi:hypothetical protein